MSAEQQPRETLGDWLAVRQASAASFEAVLEDFFGASMRADLLARCALAAQQLSPGRALGSLHVEWLEAAPHGVPIELRATPLGDVSQRRCEVAATRGALLCRAVASFSAGGSGLDYQDERLPAGLPDPESLPSTLEYARKEGWPEEYARGPVEFRRVGPLRPKRAAGESTDHVEWLKLRAALPRAAPLETAALVLLAAFYDHWEFERRVGERFDYARFAMRAQTLWIHRPARCDDWLLLRATSRVASGGRALGARELFSRDGALVASGASEARVAET